MRGCPRVFDADSLSQAPPRRQVTNAMLFPARVGRGRGAGGGNPQECLEWRCADSDGLETGGMSTLKTKKTASLTGTLGVRMGGDNLDNFGQLLQGASPERAAAAKEESHRQMGGATFQSRPIRYGAAESRTSHPGGGFLPRAGGWRTGGKRGPGEACVGGGGRARFGAFLK